MFDVSIFALCKPMQDAKINKYINTHQAVQICQNNPTLLSTVLYDSLCKELIKYVFGIYKQKNRKISKISKQTIYENLKNLKQKISWNV